MIDFHLVRRTCQQWQVFKYLSTEGVVTKSELVVRDGRKREYGWDVRYDYAVGGLGYEGNRYRYDDAPGSSLRRAERVVRSFPVGDHIVVYYDARDPRQCALMRGLEGADCAKMMFVVIFNIILIGTLIFWRQPDLRLRPFVFAGSAAAVTSGFMILATAVPFDGDPPIEVMIGSLAIVVLATVIVYVRSRGRLARQGTMALIDTRRQQIIVPSRFGEPRVTIPFDAVIKIDVEHVAAIPPVNTEGLFSVVIHFSGHDGTEKRAEVSRHFDPADARATVRVIAEHTKPPESGSDGM